MEIEPHSQEVDPRIGQSAAKADQRGGEEEDAVGNKRNYLGPDRIQPRTTIKNCLRKRDEVRRWRGFLSGGRRLPITLFHSASGWRQSIRDHRPWSVRPTKEQMRSHRNTKLLPSQDEASNRRGGFWRPCRLLPAVLGAILDICHICQPPDATWFA
jgi:hypothetical protein